MSQLGKDSSVVKKKKKKNRGLKGKSGDKDEESEMKKIRKRKKIPIPLGSQIKFPSLDLHVLSGRAKKSVTRTSMKVDAVGKQSCDKGGEGGLQGSSFRVEKEQGAKKGKGILRMEEMNSIHYRGETIVVRQMGVDGACTNKRWSLP